MSTTDPLLITGYDIVEMSSVCPALNRWRFYRIEVSPGLFGPTLVRAWGRIGSKVRVRVSIYDSMAEATDVANRIIKQKFRRGYVKVDTLIPGARPKHPNIQ